MIVACPAPVAPRVISRRHGSVPLAMIAEEFCATRGTGALMIVGGGGAGKSQALSHLASVLPNAENLVFLDEPDPYVATAAAERALVVFTSRDHGPIENLRRVRLAPWSRDELIEYLLAVHPAECRSVMSRLGPAAHQRGHSPLFWTRVLDALAADGQLNSLEQALRRCLDERFRDPETHAAVRWYCLGRTLCLPSMLEPELQRTLPRDALQFLESDCVLRTVSRDQALRGLLTKRSDELLSARWPLELVQETALQLSVDVAATKVLRQSLKRANQKLHATAASLIVRIDPTWRPRKRLHRMGLQGAYLQDVSWAGCDLSGFVLTETDFSNADLSRAELSEADLTNGVLIHCRLKGARLRTTRFIKANLERADLSGAQCPKAGFEGVRLHGARACRADFEGARFIGADCGNADFRQARFRNALLQEVDLSQADFSDADLTGAMLIGADLRQAELSGARLARAKLSSANLEDVEWSSLDCWQADLNGARCTGSVLHRTSLRGAVLCAAELGEIHWERADLQDADLRGATFHLGSSRSGLLFTPIASEGSRTGFYTDEALEQHFQTPEEIRKANLRGADLRGADVAGVDFYLVDLRNALLNPEQLEQARRTGAILDRNIATTGSD